MLNLICGPSGSGKTERLIAQIRQDLSEGIPCFLLVPEQQAYISERDLPARLPKNASPMFRIFSFSGLADAVFRTYGGITQTSISRSLQILFLWDAIRTLAPTLQQYGHFTGNSISLAEMMLQTVTELHMNGIDADRLETSAKKLSPNSSLRKKLSDLAAVDAVFRNSVQTCFGEDPADLLLRLAKKLSENRYFEGCRVYLDSFAGFTAPEFAVLEEIFKQADQVTVTLCTDHPNSSLPHFFGAKETVRQLKRAARHAGVTVRSEILPETSDRPRALQVLERDLWRFSVKKEQTLSLTEREKECVQLLSCKDPYEECEIAAWSILQLLQEGFRFHEIAIVVRDTEKYRGILDTALDRYGIPYFLSERTDVSSKPLLRLILSALHAVSFGYPTRDMITLVKTGLAGVNTKDAALFEEYCETWHISGRRFADPIWSMNPDGLTTERSERADSILEAANRTRKVLMEPLLRMETAMRTAKTMTARCRALYGYLQELKISEQLSEFAKKELLCGQKREASETLRLYRAVTDALATLSELLPNTELSTDEFSAALSVFFSESDLGSVPQSTDCVVIGSAPMLRVENIKVSLILGLCDGEFPKADLDDGILTESDRMAMEEIGILLNSRENTRFCEELFYVYRAVSKPTERLYLFCACSDAASECAPSLAFTRAAFLLQKEPVRPDAEKVRRALLSSVSESPAATDPCPLSKPAGTVLHLSQTKLKDFVLCPYRYYSTYVLKNRSVKDSAPAYHNDGIFLHHILEHFLKLSLQPDGTLQLPKKDRIEPLTDGIVQSYLREMLPFPADEADPRQLHIFYRLRKFAVKMLEEMVDELCNSDFVPFRFENVIGMDTAQADALPAVEIPLSNSSKALLSGIIDRVDRKEINGKVYIRVVDYKSGSDIRFSPDKVRNGTDFQLVLYLYALLHADPSLQAAGAQYLYAVGKENKISVCRSGFLLDDEEVKLAGDRSEDRRYLKGLTLQSASELQALQEDMKTSVSEIGDRILTGEADKLPSEEACKFCPIRNHCDQAYRKKEQEG